MKRRPARLDSPWVYAAVGASILAIPASAAAVSNPSTQDGSGSTIKARVKRRKVSYGDEVVVVGEAPAADEGQPVTLQFSSTETGPWQQIASGLIAGGGSFRLGGSLHRSGWVRAALGGPSASASSVALRPSEPATNSSTSQWVAVAASLRVRPRAIEDRGARAISLRGRLLPEAAGRRILLQGEHSGRWGTLTWARTDARGEFTLRYRPSGAGEERLRVVFEGDGANAAAWRRVGTLTVYRQAVASWYDDGGTTACGFHADYGVANLTLPCGTEVSFSYHGRTVAAVVDDRGPYVAGRTWDLNQNTAAALGVAGVVTVWASR